MNQMITNLASAITKAASKQTYYTIRFLVDRERVDDAYQAYAYFRWVDDVLDGDMGSKSERMYWLFSAVIEAIHYFVGHEVFTPYNEMRYLAVSAAHITHMLRDSFDDAQAGYYNIPREVLDAHHIEPQDVHSDAYRAWVKSRVQLARQYFKAGKSYLALVQNPRFRLATFAYTARFEWLLDTIEREGYSLRPQYNERKSIGIGLQMIWLTLSSVMHSREIGELPRPVVSHPFGKL